MAGDFDAGALKGLEDDDVRLVGDGAGVEGEGYIDLAAGGLGREGGLSRHRLAIHLKRLRRDVAVLIGLLHLHGALQGVLPAGDEAGVFHGVHDDRLIIGHDVLVAVDAVQRGCGDERVLDRDGLALVLDVRMGGDFHAVALKALEGHDFRVMGDGQGVEAEHHIDLAVRLLRGEGGLSRHRLAVHLQNFFGDLALIVGLLDVQGALDGVLLAGDEARVLHGVDDLGSVIGDDVLVAVGAVRCGGADFGMGHGDGLLAVPDVLVARDFGAAALKALEDHDVGLVLDFAGVEGEGHVHGSLGLVGGEGGLGLHGLARDHERVPGALEVELTLHDIGFSGHEVLIGHGVHDGGLVIGDHVLIAVSSVQRLGGDGGCGDGDGLVHVPDVLVACKLLAVALKGLEHDQLGAGLDVPGAELEGHIGRSLALLGREGGLGLYRLAICLKRFGSDLAVLAGLLDLNGTLQGVFLAGDEVFIGNRVDDDRLIVGDDVLVLVDAVQRRGGDARVADGDRLPLILDVGMGCKLAAFMLKGLEGHEMGLVLEGERVEGEGHVHGSLGLVGREGGLCGDGLAVHLQGLLGDLALAVGLLDVERALDGVLLAGYEVLVCHAVGDRGLVVGGHVLVAVSAVYGCGPDFGHDDGDLLVHVGLVGVLRDEGVPVIVQSLVDRDGLAAEVDGVDVEFDDLEAGGLACREGLLHGDGLAVSALERIAGLGVVKLGHELVGAVGDEVGVGHLVGDLYRAHADVRVAVHRVVGLGGDCGLHVRQRAEVVHLAVAADDDRGLDELVALVGGAAKLLDGVGPVGQCALGVIGLGVAEPDTGGGVQFGAVDGALGLERPVVAVGVVGVLVPRGGGGEVAVLVRHDHVALAGGVGGELEGHPGEAVGIRIPLLGELKVAAHDLVLDGSVVLDGVHHRAVLGDAELVHGVVQDVALGSLDLLHGVGAVGEQPRVGGGLPVLDGEGLDDLTLGVGHAVHDDGVVVEGLQLELRPVEGEAVLRVAGLGVGLDEFHAAALHLVLRGEGVDLAVLADLHTHLGGGVEVAVVGPGLADDVVAVGQAVGTGGGEALGVGCDDLHGLALGVGLAVHLHGVLVVVDDGEADALEGRAALRGLAGLGVELLHGYPAANHRFGNLRRIISNVSARGEVFVNLLKIDFIVQLVALGSLGFIDGNRTTRKTYIT